MNEQPAISRPAQFDRDLVALMPSLRAHAVARLRNGAEADDLVQRTVLRALNAWHQFTPGTNFKGWLHRILFNEMISGFRRQKRAPVSLDDEDNGVMAAANARQENLMDQRQVREVMKILPVQHRHVLLRVCVEGRSYEEAAAEIGVSVGTIKSRLWRARTAMEQILGAA